MTAPTTPVRRGAPPRRISRGPTLAGAIGLVFFVIGCCVGLRPFFDNSFFTHLATGRLIIDSGIPTQDPYSFTAAGEPWIVQSWLASLLLGAAERAFGILGVRLLAAALVGTLFALAWRLTRPARSLLPRVLLAGMFVAVGAPFLTPRPLLIGLIALALTLIVVLEARDARWLVPIFWVWTNAHGSFPLGLVALGCIAAGAWLEGDRDRRTWYPLGWAALGTVLGAINPIGPKLVAFPIGLLTRMEVLQRVVEWQSPNFSAAYARWFLLLVIVGVVALVRRPSPRQVVPFVVFLAAALLGQRNIPFAAVVFLPGLALGFAGLGHLDGRERGPLPAIVTVAALLAGVVVGSGQLAQPAFDLTSYPTDALSWVAQHGGLGAGQRVATEDTVGNTLELLYGTQAGAFFDDRYDMYPVALSQDYLRLHDGLPGWNEVLDRHDVHTLVWTRGGTVSQLVADAPAWRIVYQDPTTFVACRRGVTPNC